MPRKGKGGLTSPVKPFHDKSNLTTILFAEKNCVNMKTIQWYPGHMAKAMRMMAENLKLCDAVVFVLDARSPASSYNARLTQLAGTKPVLYLLNKGDLADGGADAARVVLKGR